MLLLIQKLLSSESFDDAVATATLLQTLTVMVSTLGCVRCLLLSLSFSDCYVPLTFSQLGRHIVPSVLSLLLSICLCKAHLSVCRVCSMYSTVPVVQTFLSAHELSLCLHSSSAVFNKCCRQSATFDSVEKYSLIYGAFYQLLNSMLVHRAETVFHLVPVFVGAIKRILTSLLSHSFTVLLLVFH